MRRFCLLIMLIVFAAGCAVTPQPTATPTETPTPTLTPTSTPLPEPTPLPRVLELTRATDPSQQAFLSVIHAAVNVPVFDVYVERLAIATNMSYGQYAQPAGIVAGDYFLRVVPNGVRPDAGEVIYETPIALAGGDSLLLIFTGTPEALSMSYFPQALDPLPSDQSRVTIIHAIPEGPAITLLQSGVALTVPMNFASAAFPINLPSGEITLDFQSDSAPILSLPINLQPQFSYILVLAGDPADLETVTVIEARSRVPGIANIRAINASAAIGPVDIYLEDEPFISNLDYTRASDPQIRAAQVYNVNVFAAGADRSTIEPLLTTQVAANSDDFITLILVGSPQDLRLLPYREDRSITRPDEARIAFINTLQQVSRVRIDLADRVLTEVGELGFGQPPSVVNLFASIYRFGWMRMENGSPTELVELAEGVQLEAGRSYLYLMTGRINDPPVILSDMVGFDQSLVDLSESEQPTATPETPTHARFVNAVKGGLPVNVLLNGQTIVSELSYGSSSAINLVDAGTHSLEVVQASNGQALLTEDVTFEISTPYSIVIHGFGTDPVQLLQVNDSEMVQGTESPTVRVINATIFGELTVGLGHSRAQGIDQSQTIFSESPGSDIFRRSMAAGIERLHTVTETKGRAASNVSLAPLGPNDLHIMDIALGMIAASFRQVEFAPGVHWDVIIFQNQDSMLVEGFAVRYPSG